MQVSIRVEIRLRVKKDLSYQEYFLGFSFIVRVEQNFAEINLYQHHFNMTQIKKMLDYEGSRCAQVLVVPWAKKKCNIALFNKACKLIRNQFEMSWARFFALAGSTAIANGCIGKGKKTFLYIRFGQKKSPDVANPNTMRKRNFMLLMSKVFL